MIELTNQNLPIIDVALQENVQPPFHLVKLRAPCVIVVPAVEHYIVN